MRLQLPVRVLRWATVDQLADELERRRVNLRDLAAERLVAAIIREIDEQPDNAPQHLGATYSGIDRCPRCGGPAIAEQIAVPEAHQPPPWPTVPGPLRCALGPLCPGTRT